MWQLLHLKFQCRRDWRKVTDLYLVYWLKSVKVMSRSKRIISLSNTSLNRCYRTTCFPPDRREAWKPSLLAEQCVCKPSGGRCSRLLSALPQERESNLLGNQTREERWWWSLSRERHLWLKDWRARFFCRNWGRKLKNGVIATSYTAKEKRLGTFWRRDANR